MTKKDAAAAAPSTSKAAAASDGGTKESAAAAASDAAKYADMATKREASWPFVLFYIHLNILGVYGIAVLLSSAFFSTMIFTGLLTVIGVLGMTCGAHRLWAHRSYRANSFLRGLLMMCQTMAGQGSIYDWVRLHRLHHKTFKTADDPYYSDGTFLDAQVFAQIRSLSPRQAAMLRDVDVSDLEEDSIVMFQKRFYWLLYAVFFLLLPMNAPLEYWNDSLQSALFVALSMRYLVVLNMSWLINSAHFIFGLDARYKPSDSNMIFLVTKSQWPLYHYLLPWDYQTGEFGDYGEGCTTALVRVFAALGWADQLQTVTTEVVKQGLTKAVDTGRSVVDCLVEAAKEERNRLPYDHYLNPEKYQ